MPLKKYPVFFVLVFMLGACIGPKVEVPPVNPDAAKAGVPSLSVPVDARRHTLLTPKERHKVEDTLSSQAAVPAPPPVR